MKVNTKTIRKIIAAAIILFLIVFIFILTETFSSDNHQKELNDFIKQYNRTDLAESHFLSRYKQTNEIFDLFQHNNDYFIIWSQKEFMFPERYKISGGQLPTSNINHPVKLSEFEKMDSNGFLYILYGPYQYHTINLDISNHSSLKKYQINTKYTFVIYKSDSDCSINPILG